MWIADLKVLLRSTYDKDIHTVCFWGQFVSWKYFWHHYYSTIVKKMGWNTVCCHQMLAVLLLLNCDSSLVFYVNLLMCNVLILWRTLQKAYILQFLNCKKLKFWNCKKLNLWNVFTSNFFTVSKLQKNCLWERRFHIS